MADSKKAKKDVPRPKKVEKPSPSSLATQPKIIILGIFVSLIASVALTHLLVPSPIDAVAYILPKPMELPNDTRLAKAQLLLEDQIYGPECLAIHPKTGKVYTGLKTGLICELDLDGKEPRIVRAVRLTRLEGCDGSYNSMPKCGRPLGLRFNVHGDLLVLDAYLGLFWINWKTEKVHQFFAGGAPITNDDDAPPARYLNDLDILPDKKIVISESSNKFDDRDFLYDVMEHRPNGRLLVFDPNDNSLSVLVKDLYFPNGVQVVDGNVIFAEMGMARIMTYDSCAGKLDILIDHLPGYPDNIRAANGGGLWVPIAATRGDIDEYLAERPAARRLITKLLSPSALGKVIGALGDQIGIVMKIDTSSGEVLDVLVDEDGKVSDISIAIDDGKGNLLMGNDDHYYIGRLKL